MSKVHSRLLTISMVIAGLALAGCNNRQYENQTDQVTTAPPTTQEPPLEPMEPTEPTRDPMQDRAMQDPDADMMIGDVMRSPDQWVGKTLAGTVTVPDVPTDRGFWVEAGGQRIFAILSDAPGEAFDINPGQTLRIKEATVRDATYLASMPGEPLEEQTKQLAQTQPVFLIVDQENIEITNEGGTMPPEQPDQPMDEPIEPPSQEPPNPIQ